MPGASFRFYAELNDFLPPERRGVAFLHSFLDRATVKDMIESFGVPHTEVDLILADGESVDFAHIVRDGEQISVYPVFEALDISPVLRVRPEPLRDPRFVLDTHLGRLAGYLRMVGFDTLYSNDCGDEELARISSGEHRILLTRDRGLLKRSAVTHGYYVRETAVRRQLAEVLRRFDLARAMRPFRLCLRCNTVLEPAARERVADRLPPRTAELFDEFPGLPRLRARLLEGRPLPPHAGVHRLALRGARLARSMMVPMDRQQAWDILCEFTQSESLRKHALAVEACVAAYARKLGEDETRWSVTALLHDFDWEIHPQLPDHPTKGEPILAARGVDEDIRRAILSHADFTGVPRDTPLARTLYACDELAGFITAVSYVKPSRSVFEVDVKSVRKKMKDKAFARAVNRQDIVEGAAGLGVDLDAHISFCIAAMQERAEELGLKGAMERPASVPGAS